MSRKVFSINLDAELMKRVDEQAEWQGFCRSDFVEMELAKLFGMTNLIPGQGKPPHTLTTKVKK